jgi:hypothetical protein
MPQKYGTKGQGCFWEAKLVQLQSSDFDVFVPHRVAVVLQREPSFLKKPEVWGWQFGEFAPRD